MLPAKCAVFLALTIGSLIAASSAGAGTDPRQCAAGTELTCSRTAAIVALKRYVALETGRKVWRYGPVTCISPGGSLLAWFCDFPGVHSNVGFRQTGGSWTTTVRVLCRSSAPATVRAAC